MATDSNRSNQPDRNPDPITGAPGSHPVGTGIGAAAGGATGVGAAIAIGAAGGSVAGPIGTAIGAIAGAVVGGLAGKAVGEAHDPTEDDTYWREQHKTRPYVQATHDYDRDLAPAYRFGSHIGRNVHNDDYPNASQRDTTSTTSTTASSGPGVGDKLKNAAASAKDALTPDRKTEDHSYDRYENDIRTHWDKVRGNSSLNYDQARDAIKDAYNRRLQLREERLNVGTERVQTGEASVRKEVVTEHRTVEVPVQREELVIERRPGSGQAATGAVGDAETIRVPLSEDRVNVSKDTVVTEEVNVGKRAVTDTQKVEADVRKEKLNVDDQTRTGKINR